MWCMWRCGTHTQGMVSTQGYLKAAGFKTPLTERPARLAQCVVTDLWPAVTRHPRGRDLQRCDFLLRILHFALKVGTMPCPCSVCAVLCATSHPALVATSHPNWSPPSIRPR